MRIHQNLTIDKLSTNSLNFNSFLKGRSPSKLIQGFFNLNSLFVLMLFSKRYADLHIKLYTITSQTTRPNISHHTQDEILDECEVIHVLEYLPSHGGEKNYKMWSEIGIKRVQFGPIVNVFATCFNRKVTQNLTLWQV